MTISLSLGCSARFKRLLEKVAAARATSLGSKFRCKEVTPEARVSESFKNKLSLEEYLDLDSFPRAYNVSAVLDLRVQEYALKSRMHDAWLIIKALRENSSRLTRKERARLELAREESGNLPQMLISKREELKSTCTAIFKEEIAKGNFTILSEPSSLGFVIVEDLREILEGRTDHPELLRCLKERLAQPGLYPGSSYADATKLLLMFSSILDEEAGSIIWARVENYFKARVLEPYLLDEDDLRIIKRLLLGCPLAAKDLLSLSGLFISLLARELVSESVLLGEVQASLSSVHVMKFVEEKYSLSIKPDRVDLLRLDRETLPLFVKKIDPALFMEELAKKGVDPAVADILTENWEGSFSSFLEAASSLSAE